MTIFLRFADEAEATKVLSRYRVEGDWIRASHEHALDPVGTVYRSTGAMIKTSEGEFPEMAALPGYHVNFIGVLPASAEAYIVEPKSPSRVFA